MSALVQYHVEDGVAFIGLANPPVNALSQPVRAALAAACEVAERDPAVRVLILYGEGGSFSAGTDIEEFGTPAALSTPDFPTLLRHLTQLDKPLIAALEGVALGGGLELALACGYRIAEPSAKLGLPEIQLGLIPGGGGTQRLPRLIGVDAALSMIISGQPLLAARARELGLIDRLADSADALLDNARAFAEELAAQKAPPQPQPPQPEPGAGLADDFFQRYIEQNQKRWRGQVAPRLAVEAVQTACELPLEQGLVRESALFSKAMESSQSTALCHVFFAERQADKVPAVERDTPRRPVAKVAVIGAGTMGGGIAMNFANAGIPVVLLEVKREALDRGLAQIRKNYEISIQRGKLSRRVAEQRLALIDGTLDYADLADADLVIEAVFESMDIKRQVFGTLDKVCKPGAILATNTSTLNVDEIAAVTQRPQDVIGLHFFSPANVMRLLEVVRGEATAPEVLATALGLAKKIGKVAVVSGVCFGFIGNRMLEPYAREAHRLVLEGATPAQVDRVLTELGLAMGVLSMYDLAGIDVGYLVRESRRDAISHDPSYCKLADELYGMGRYGQKRGAVSIFTKGASRKKTPKSLQLPSVWRRSWIFPAVRSPIRKSTTAAYSC
ncbi:3-hydroxyacyl-CoA dehydrogenase NAD-binding domain-containing protein [Alkalilimnicola ehrlichii]|uniref:3-hydroxyacyl-CoA dehydrogenase NAD-binding domain-containing protein n=1 Tax=Alkalilimnicola ehrlichii TaxID=351052 RepID=UPI002161E9BF|nr:3-hydroxyacyl-CoA dehydrogenase NAD-binding domain-containing protein [Alkalilimnicola ehrlichii]